MAHSRIVVSCRLSSGQSRWSSYWSDGRVTILLLLGLLLGCGKKEPPPSPDRWPPKLLSVKAVDNLHLCCYFSEELDKVSGELKENYAVVGPTDSLKVVAAFVDASGVEVNLVTSRQKEVPYSLLVQGVRDLAGNHIAEGTEGQFTGTLLPDTIPPRASPIYPEDLDLRVPADTSLTVGFSEPMDTTSVSPLLLPSRLKVTKTWNASMTTLTVVLGSSGEDTLKEDCRYNLLLPSTAKDLGGNRLKSMLSILFSTGDSLPKGSISGRVRLPEREPGEAIILLLSGDVLEESSPFSVTQAEDSSGAYTLSHLPPGRYFLLGAHTAGDRRWVGGYGVSPPNFEAHSIELPADSALKEMDISFYAEAPRTVALLEMFQELLEDSFPPR